jgi:TfoX/Sxy family transcriptional regulator of competence genes
MPTKWRKSPPELVERFLAALPDDPRVERRQMFGYPCAFTGGNMFTGLHQENMIVRLGDGERAELCALPGSGVFSPMPGRVMREYALVPPSMLSDGRTLARWVRRAFDYAAGLPKKQAEKAQRAKKASKSPRTKRSKK